MNIAVCVNTLSAGGAESFAASMALEYRKKSHKVIVIVLNVTDEKGLKLEKELVSAEIPVFNLHYSSKWNWFTFPISLARIFKENAIEVIHSNLEQMDFIVMLTKLLYPQAIRIRTLHSMNAFPTFPLALHKMLFKFYDKTIGCGKRMQDNYTIPSLRSSMIAIDNGIPIIELDTEERNRIRNKIRKEIGIKETDFIFLQIGRMSPVLGALCKGHDFTFNAVHNLQRQDFKVVFIGEDNAKNNPDLYTQEYVKDSRLIFQGIRSNPLDYIIASDAILAPSRVEGLPISTLEGVVYGLPVVCSSIEVFDLFKDDSSIRMNINNPDELSEKMNEMIDNYLSYKRNATKNIAYYSQKYSVEQTSNKYLQLIGRIVKQRTENHK